MNASYSNIFNSGQAGSRTVANLDDVSTSRRNRRKKETPVRFFLEDNSVGDFLDHGDAEELFHVARRQVQLMNILKQDYLKVLQVRLEQNGKKRMIDDRVSGIMQSDVGTHRSPAFLGLVFGLHPAPQPGCERSLSLSR